MINVHERRYPGHSIDELAGILATVGSPRDRIWPRSGHFPPMRLDGPLDTLPTGGHGPIRYHTTHYEPDRIVSWRFDESAGINGTHRFELLRDDGRGPGLRHTLAGHTYGKMRAVWPIAMRWLHDACLDELFDQVATSLGDHPPRRRPRPYASALLALTRRRSVPGGRSRPSRVMRLAFRAPVEMYRMGLGSVFRGRIIAIVHRGRRSGVRYVSGLEVLERDDDGRLLVLAAWGRRADWLRNIEHNGIEELWDGRRRTGATHEILDRRRATKIVEHYELQHPRAARRILPKLNADYEPTPGGRERLLESAAVVAISPGPERSPGQKGN